MTIQLFQLAPAYTISSNIITFLTNSEKKFSTFLTNLEDMS